MRRSLMLSLLTGMIAGGAGLAIAGNTPLEVTAGEVAKNPAKYYGTKVAITAEIEKRYGAHSFTLDEDELFAGPDVLVITQEPIAEKAEDQVVTVVGSVRQFVQADIERDYDWFDFDSFAEPDIIATFKSRPVLVAESITSRSGADVKAEDVSSR